MVNSAATTPSSFSSVLVLLILCCRVVTLRLQISGFPSVLCVVWVKQEQRGGIFFLDWEKKRNGVKLPSALFAMCWWHAWRTKDDVAAPPWSPLSFMTVWSGWICDISEDLKTPPQTSERQRRLFVLIETNICWFWFCSCWTVSLFRAASLSWEGEDVSFYSERSLESVKTHSSIQLFIFFHPRLLSGIALHNWLSRNILQVQNKNPAHAAIFSQFPDKTDASFDIYNWKETKKTNQQVSLDGAKNLWGAGWEVKMGYLCPLWHHTGLLGQTSVLF